MVIYCKIRKDEELLEPNAVDTKQEKKLLCNNANKQYEFMNISVRAKKN